MIVMIYQYFISQNVNQLILDLSIMDSNCHCFGQISGVIGVNLLQQSHFLDEDLDWHNR